MMTANAVHNVPRFDTDSRKGAAHDDVRVPVLPEVTRVLCGLAGYGAALLYTAEGSTALLSASGNPALHWIVVAASLAWALTLTVWATAVLKSSRHSWPAFTRFVVPGTVTVTLAAVLRTAMFAPLGERSLDITALCAVALGLVMLACRGYLARRPEPAVADVGLSPAPAGRVLLGLAAGSVLVAAITAPGLAASTAGDFAVPHSEHGQNHQPVLPEPGHHH